MIIKNDWDSKDYVQATDLNTLADGITSLNVYGEDWSGLCNGSHTIFPNNDMSYQPFTIRVYLNGLRCRLYPGTGPTGVYDYTETVMSNVGTRFVMYSPPASGSVLLVDYQKANV